jgi:hypothetical protein
VFWQRRASRQASSVQGSPSSHAAGSLGSQPAGEVVEVVDDEVETTVLGAALLDVVELVVSVGTVDELVLDVVVGVVVGTAEVVDDVVEVVVSVGAVDELVLDVVVVVVVVGMVVVGTAEVVEDVEVEVGVEVDEGAGAVLVDDELDVVVEVEEVVVGKNAPKPVISRMALPLAAASSQVVTNRESGWTGSKARPKGGVVKPSAKRLSVGVLAPPSGRPVAGSITTRQISRSTKLV